MLLEGIIALSALVRGEIFKDPSNPYNLTDCRNETAPEFGVGSEKLRVLSWHIHYTTNTSDQERFYWAMIDEFEKYMDPNDHTCPFGPNWGQNYPFMCSLEDAYEEAWAVKAAMAFEEEHGIKNLRGSPWSTPQRAFYIPVQWMAEVWPFAMANMGWLDLLKHPNTGCMHDDHSLRALWETPTLPGETSPRTPPEIYVYEFPCNVPATGCNDTHWDGPPSCGCDLPVASDAPEDSCTGCTAHY